MAANTIASRIADFLKKYPPFTSLSKEELYRISSEAVVCHFESGDYVFRQGEAGSGNLFVVKEGVIHLERQEDDALVLVDICDEGDLFGVRAMLSGNPYVFRARSAEESLVYALPVALFKPLIENHSQIAMFFAAGLAGGQAGLLDTHTTKRFPYQDSGSLLNWNRPLEKTHGELVWMSPDKTIKEVATAMTDKKIGSMVLCHVNGELAGIVTDTDFREKVSTGKASIDASVSDIMSTDVVTMPLGQPLSNYLLKMLRHKIRHICITTDGKPIGMLSERDLMAAHQNHPVALVYAIEEAPTLQKLIDLRNQADDLIRFYLEQQVSISLTASLATHINDALIRRVIDIALQEVQKTSGTPSVDFAWISLGSEGRSEQLIRTDQDNAIIYEDVNGSTEDKEKVKQYFLQLGSKANDMLAEAGFEYCPADMMAGNPQWCQPLSEWKQYFSGWIRQPQEKALMLSTIFFDYRRVYGSEALLVQLKDHVKKEVLEESIFLNFLAKNALKNPPPLSFFKNLVVERSGEHQDEFDIKARAMMPFVDIARVLSLDIGQLDEMNTVARYHLLAREEPKRKELYHAAADSYEYLMRIRALNGFTHHDSGRFISIENLGKLDRQILRNTFEPIYQLQQMLELRYQLSYFN
ncbi:DUF294 nucleotidyltransferase-like domain-containing protein [Fulvivirga ulvae]|uniref:DUF294 nucleotidyltransferase-like domain-containing protein n=1 Tax=Fulvivirga ulvae TaxID=2904245 RepID=UPI001F4549A8|nr:DUF294 nucleotidyltransferase-like domain-containing protein [Fulvivirga ulvae]UII34692.1 DUF294 nucleotidyltransferase-like domain-containing protein [Fulvivirga ulvae]